MLNASLWRSGASVPNGVGGGKGCSHLLYKLHRSFPFNATVSLMKEKRRLEPAEAPRAGVCESSQPAFSLTNHKKAYKCQAIVYSLLSSASGVCMRSDWSRRPTSHVSCFRNLF